MAGPLSTIGALPRTLKKVVDYLDPAHSVTIPIWNERRVAAEMRAARTITVVPATESPRDILLVHGFIDDGGRVAPLGRRLEQAGHRVHPAKIGRNWADSPRMLARLELELERVTGEIGRSVTVVGHSRGGSLGRALAVRNPDRVNGLVTLGSPLARPYDVHLLLRAVKLAMWGLTSVGLTAPGMYENAPWGDQDDTYNTAMRSPFPADVPFVSIASPTDGMVCHEATQDPAAKLVDVDVTHVGLVEAPEALHALLQVLDDLP